MIESLINKQIGSLPAEPPKLANNALDLFSLKGKTASITGSSQGIGLAVAECFAQAGANVAIWYHNTEATVIAAEIASKYSVKVKAYKCNVSRVEQVEKTIDAQLKEFGKIDVFVANAGIGHPDVPVVDTDIDFYHKIITNNVDSVYYCAKFIGKVFKSQGFGSFIVTSSQAGHIVTVPHDQAAYNASKAAIRQLTRSLAVEWAGFARANSISPGYIATEIAKFVPPERKAEWWKRIPMGREGLPKELVGAFLYFASDASTFTTGSDLIVDGGYCCP